MKHLNRTVIAELLQIKCEILLEAQMLAKMISPQKLTEKTVLSFNR